MTGDNLPKSGGTMTTIGRQRVTYSSRSSSGIVAASTPNISTTVPGNAILPVGMITGDALAFGDHHMASTVPHSLRQARDNTILDLQAQLKEVFRFYVKVKTQNVLEKTPTQHFCSSSFVPGPA